MAFIRTTAINKLLGLKERIRVIQGGTWAGKTYGILPIIIDVCAKKSGEQYTIVAETVPALKKGAIKDFIEIMQETGRWKEERYSRSDKKYTFSNGSYIEFSSFKTIGDAKAAGKRTGLFINEGQYIPFDVADALMTRTSGNIWVDFNPTKRFWAHEELVDEGVADFIVLKYTDNEGLPQSILDDLLRKKKKAFHNCDLSIEELYKEINVKSKYWANWCKVYLDGLVGNLEGVIFQENINWQIIDELPEEARSKGFGLDFGYTNDPSTLIEGFEWNGTSIYDEHIYETNLRNVEIDKRITDLNLDRANKIVADHAEPKSIADLRAYGLNVVECIKGKDSVNFGIDKMQEKMFYVTARSVNTIREFRNYQWRVTRDGKPMNEPIDSNNHSIDAIRYLEADNNEFWVI